MKKYNIEEEKKKPHRTYKARVMRLITIIGLI